jgi:hypothetical protein
MIARPHQRPAASLDSAEAALCAAEARYYALVDRIPDRVLADPETADVLEDALDRASGLSQALARLLAERALARVST